MTADHHRVLDQADPARERRAVFLDRDDTLIVDQGYMSNPDQVCLLPGVPDALEQLQQAGLPLVLVSNQSGVARGLITVAQVQAIEARLRDLLPGISLAGAEYCFHGPEEGCACRKPGPLMLQRAARRLGLDLPRSVMVGDRPSDVAAGSAAGCWTVLLGDSCADTAQTPPDHLARTLAVAAPWIVTPRGPRGAALRPGDSAELR